MLFDCFISWLYIHNLKLFLGKNIFSANFPLVLDFQCKAFEQTISCVRTRATQTFGRLSDTFGRMRSCRELTWQWPSGRVSYVSRRIPYRFKSTSFSPSRRTSSYFHFLSFDFEFWCDFLVLSHEFSAYFVVFYILSPVQVFWYIFYILFNLF